MGRSTGTACGSRRTARPLHRGLAVLLRRRGIHIARRSGPLGLRAHPPSTLERPCTDAGYTAAILWDLHDADVDNHDQNSSEDRLAKAS